MTVAHPLALDEGEDPDADLPEAELRRSCGADRSSGIATLEEVGRELGVTRERVRQIEAKALRKLRCACRRAGLDEELAAMVGRCDADLLPTPRAGHVQAPAVEEPTPRAPAPPQHAHLPTPETAGPGDTMWCGRLLAAVTVQLCQRRHASRTQIARGYGAGASVTYPGCACCPEGAQLAARLGDAAKAPPRPVVRLPVLRLVPPAPPAARVRWFGDEEESAMSYKSEARTDRDRADSTPREDAPAAACAIPDCGGPQGAIFARTRPELVSMCARHRRVATTAYLRKYCTPEDVIPYLARLQADPRPRGGRPRSAPNPSPRRTKAQAAPRAPSARGATATATAPATDTAYAAAMGRIQRLNTCAERCGGLDELEALLTAVLGAP